MEVLKKAYGFIIKWEEQLAGITLVASVLVVMAGAVGRMISHPLGWSMDIATFLFAWTVFLAADAAWRENKHVSLDIVVRLLPKRAQLVVSMFNHVIIGIFLALLIRYGISMSWIRVFVPSRVSPASAIPGRPLPFRLAARCCSSQHVSSCGTWLRSTGRFHWEIPLTRSSQSKVKGRRP